MKTMILTMILTIFCSSCVGTLAQAPVNANFNWRSNEDNRIATTSGHAEGEDGTQTVNAEKKNDLATSVTTSSGSATTNDGKEGIDAK